MLQKAILVTGARAPAAVHIARLLHAANHQVLMCDHLDKPLGANSVCHAGYRRLPSFRLAPEKATDALLNILEQDQIEYVIPTCEEVFYLAQIWASLDINAKLFAPPIALLETVHNKFDFVRLIEEIGLSAPRTSLLRSKADLENFRDVAASHVFKPVWSRFGSHVAMRPSLSRFDRIEPTQQSPWVAQEFVAGDEICVYAIANEGRLLTLSAYRGLIRVERGASVCFEPVELPVVHQFVETFVEATKWTGQVSFDFIVQNDGTVLPLECNPRATSGVHFYENAETFAHALLTGGAEIKPDISSLQGVRLAIWVYGALGLGRRHDFKSFWRAVTSAKDILKTQDDPIGFVPQMRSMWEVVTVAYREKLSLQQASTYDLEWDGPDQSNISK